MFFKIGVLRNLSILTRKYLCWGLFLTHLQGLQPVTLFKRDLNTGVSCEYCEIYIYKFINSFFVEHFMFYGVGTLSN